MKHNMFLFAKFPRFLESDNMDGYNNSSVENIPPQTAELCENPKEVLESDAFTNVLEHFMNKYNISWDPKLGTIKEVMNGIYNGDTDSVAYGAVKAVHYLLQHADEIREVLHRSEAIRLQHEDGISEVSYPEISTLFHEIIPDIQETIRQELTQKGIDDVMSSSAETTEAPNAPLTIKESPVTKDTLTWPDGVEKHVAIDDKTLKVETAGWKIESREDVEVRVSPEIEVDRAVYDGDGKLVLQPGDILPEGDITEFVDGEFAWEQLLSWKAALYAAAIAGKRVPNDEEYVLILENGKTLARELLKTTPAAGRRSINGNFDDKGDGTFLWVSTQNDTSSAWRRSFNETIYMADYRYDTDKGNGYAVRCLENQ